MAGCVLILVLLSLLVGVITGNLTIFVWAYIAAIPILIITWTVMVVAKLTRP